MRISWTRAGRTSRRCWSAAREDARSSGFFNLSQIARGSLQSAYLGYAVASKFAGQGYMREGIELVLREAFVTFTAPDRGQHPAGQRQPRSRWPRGAGFAREGFSPRYLKIGGRWRDHERWAILAEDWRERNQRLGLPAEH